MEHHGADDANIVAGLRVGDREAWLRLYDRHAGPLWRHVARLLGNDPHATADVMQATMIAAAESARNFDEARGTLWMWLYGIARRQTSLYQRTRRRDECRVAASDIAAVSDWLAGDGLHPPESLESGETAGFVRAALADLVDDDAVVLVAAYMEQMTMSQIAMLLGKSTEATRSKMARARRRFRAAFARRAQQAATRSTDHVT